MPIYKLIYTPTTLFHILLQPQYNQKGAVNHQHARFSETEQTLEKRETKKTKKVQRINPIWTLYTLKHQRKQIAQVTQSQKFLLPWQIQQADALI